MRAVAPAPTRIPTTIEVISQPKLDNLSTTIKFAFDIVGFREQYIGRFLV